MVQVFKKDKELFQCNYLQKLVEMVYAYQVHLPKFSFQYNEQYLDRWSRAPLSYIIETYFDSASVFLSLLSKALFYFIEQQFSPLRMASTLAF